VVVTLLVVVVVLVVVTLLVVEELVVVVLLVVVAAEHAIVAAILNVSEALLVGPAGSEQAKSVKLSSVSLRRTRLWPTASSGVGVPMCTLVGPAYAPYATQSTYWLGTAWSCGLPQQTMPLSGSPAGMTKSGVTPDRDSHASVAIIHGRSAPLETFPVTVKTASVKLPPSSKALSTVPVYR
jgi:hypothetical protein